MGSWRVSILYEDNVRCNVRAVLEALDVGGFNPLRG